MCDAKIRPFYPVQSVEMQCNITGTPLGGHTQHRGVLRNYAGPGSEITITWSETDRRTFRGRWAPCVRGIPQRPCILPAGHHGECAA